MLQRHHSHELGIYVIIVSSIETVAMQKVEVSMKFETKIEFSFQKMERYEEEEEEFLT